MNTASNDRKQRALQMLKEPLIHFFAIGVLLFVVHGLLSEDPRTIRITPGVSAELTRRFQDQHGRKPDAAELEAALRAWKREEALFREALREGLERDDAAVRVALVNKMQMRAALEVPKREPTDPELQEWMRAHRKDYELPARYDFEFLAFAKSDAAALGQVDSVERTISQGGSPVNLGRPLIGGNLTVADMKDRIEPELAAAIPTLPVGVWRRLETEQNQLLVRVKGVQGGLPPLQDVRTRLITDWSFAKTQEAVDAILQRTVDQYRFEEHP